MTANANSTNELGHPASQLPRMALSIRQPYAELILRGVKTIEYRSLRTHRRERVYIYASKIPADDAASWARVQRAPGGDLPTGLLVGTVEIVACEGSAGNFQWSLARPERLSELIKPTRKPQPVFFRPF